MKRRFKTFLMALLMCLIFIPVTSYAAASTSEMAQFPNVTLSPDGSQRAWTMDAGNKANERLP